MKDLINRLLGRKQFTPPILIPEPEKTITINNDPLTVFTIGKISKIMDGIAKDLNVSRMFISRGQYSLSISLRMSNFKNTPESIQETKELVIRYFGLKEDSFIINVRGYGKSLEISMTNDEQKLDITIESS